MLRLAAAGGFPVVPQAGRRERLFRSVQRFLAAIANRGWWPISVAMTSAGKLLLLSFRLLLFVSLILLGFEELMVFGTIRGIRTVLQLFLYQRLVMITQIVCVQFDLFG